MKNLFTLGMIAAFAATPVMVEASGPHRVREAKYNSSDILYAEYVYYYDNKDLKSIRRSETESEMITWKYDQKGNMIQEDNRFMDTWGNNDWVVNNSLQYTYDASGKTLTESYYMRGWTGQFGIVRFTEYEYDENGNLYRQLSYSDDTKSALNQITEYTEYTEAGKVGKKSISYVTDGEASLYSYEVYTYNESDLLSQTDGYGMNYMTMELYMNSRTNYEYNAGGMKTEEIYGTFSPSDGTYANNSRIVYVYEEESGLMTGDINYYWGYDTSDWIRSVRNEYTYSEQLDGENKAPRLIDVETYEDYYHISWMSPVESDGIEGYNVYLNDQFIETLPKGRQYYQLSEMVKGTNLFYVSTVYNGQETNISGILELECLDNSEETEYPMPSFGGISYIKEVNYQIEYEIWWNAPETDMEVTGYTVHYGYMPLTEEPVQGTTFRCTLRKLLDNITWGVSAHYADGGESEADHKDYSVSALLSSIINSSVGKEVWSYGGNICIDGANIRSVEVYDATGMKVHSQVINNGINLINLPGNVYIIKAETDNGVITHKVFNR